MAQSPGAQFNVITTIIPYYQRKPGILGRAVRSVIKQSLPERIDLIIVDDESPVPAAYELQEIDVPDRISVRVIRQLSGGPGAARNAGLDNTSEETRYVAFLDSDDEWTEDHLENAVIALDHGYDFYFADFYQLHQTVSAFARAGRLDVAKHERLRGAQHLFAYAGDMVNQIITGNVIGTSTVVFDFRKFPEIRFREHLRFAGEDYLFWMEFAKRGARFVFSSRPEAIYGAGVNVYSGARFGSLELLRRIQNELEYRKATDEVVALTEVQKKFLKTKIAELRENFLRALFQYMVDAKKVPASLILLQLRQDPATMFALPKLIGRVATRLWRQKG